MTDRGSKSNKVPSTKHNTMQNTQIAIIIEKVIITFFNLVPLTHITNSAMMFTMDPAIPIPRKPSIPKVKLTKS